VNIKFMITFSNLNYYYEGT